MHPDLCFLRAREQVPTVHHAQAPHHPATPLNTKQHLQLIQPTKAVHPPTYNNNQIPDGLKETRSLYPADTDHISFVRFNKM